MPHPVNRCRLSGATSYRRVIDCGARGVLAVGSRYACSGCPSGACVVAAIERQAGVLASSAPEDHRLKALKYVVHFVTDLHQPLHAGFFEDRGGNRFQVQAFGRGTNLHAVWATGPIENWPGGLEALTAEVRRSGMVHEQATARQWAEQSCRIVASPEFYP